MIIPTYIATKMPVKKSIYQNCIMTYIKKG